MMGPNSVLGHPLGVEGRRRGRRDNILSLSGWKDEILRAQIVEMLNLDPGKSFGEESYCSSKVGRGCRYIVLRAAPSQPLLLSPTVLPLPPTHI